MSESDLLGGFEDGNLFGGEETSGPDLFGESAPPEASLEMSTDAVTLPVEPSAGAKPQNSGYLVIARKYRPQTFDQIVGQEGVQQALRGAIERGSVSHAYLFSGPRGTGKTSTARILAKALNCQNGGPRPDPCGECPSCRAIAAGSSLDVIEIDAASNTGVDNIRELRSGVVLAPFSRYKVYIVDEVHMLSNQAFNALLKTLEEPPPQVIFVLATTELQKVPETVVSRCQAFTFRRFRLDELKAQLGSILDKEAGLRGLEISPDDREKVLDLVARSAEGGMRDAQVILDQVLVLSRDKMDFEQIRRFLGMADTEVLDRFVDLLYHRETGELLLLIDELAADGQDLELLVKNLCDYLRDLLLIRVAGSQSRSGLVNLSDDRYDELKTRAGNMGGAFLLSSANLFIDLAGQMKASSQPRFTLELAVFRLTELDPDVSLDSLKMRVRELEGRMGSGGSGEGGSTASPARQVSAPASSGKAPQAQKQDQLAKPEPEVAVVANDQRTVVRPEPTETGVEEFIPALVAELEQAAAHMVAIGLRDGTRVLEFNSKSAVIGVDAGEGFVYKQLTDAQAQSKIRAAVEKLKGPGFQVRFELVENLLPRDGGGKDSPAAKEPEPVKEQGAGQTDQDASQAFTPAPARENRAAIGTGNISLAESAEPGEDGEEDSLTIYYPPELIEKSMKTLSRRDFQERLEKTPILREIVDKAMQVFGIDDSSFELRIRTI